MSQLQVTGEAKIRDIQGPVIANSGVITALDGAASQYVRGDGTLADFPTSTGGGSSVSYYLNSSVSQGTIGGVAYRELSKEPIIGAGTDITISANGYVANYITDANDPDVTIVPGGNFNCEFYFSVNNNTGSPTTYAELYKYDGTTFTLLGTSAGVPESINQGTTIAPYYFAIPVATAALSVTDRLAIRIYVSVDGRTVTLHTENGHLCQVVTTLSKGMVSLNNLTDQSQYLTTGTSGTDFNIVSSGDTHTFNIPSASNNNRGLITNLAQTIGGIKTFSSNINADSGIRLKNGVAPSANGYVGIGSNTQGLTLGVYDSGSAYYHELYFPYTNGYEYTFPATSGTLALTSNLSAYVPYTGATGNVDLGLFGLTSNAVKAIGDNSTYGGVISIKQNNVIGGLIGTGYTELFGKTNRLGISFGAGSIAYLSNSVLTAERTYTLPDATGTIALTSNLSSYVPYTGATTNVDLGIYNIFSSFVYAEGAGGSTNGGILIKQYSGALAANSGYTSLFATPNQLGINFSGVYNTFLQSGTLTASRTYTLPDITGTLALLEGTQTFSGYKTFDAALELKYNIIPTPSSVGNSGIGSNGLGITITTRPVSTVYNNNLYFPSSSNTYTFPAITGTLALLEGTQTFTGVKSFDTGILLKNGVVTTTSGYTGIGAGTSGINVSLGSGGGGLLIFQSTSYNYTFPAATGTIALTSNLSSYVPYTGATANVDLGIRALFAQNIVVGQTSTQGYIHFKTGGSTALSADTSQAPYGTNGMIYSFDQTGGNYKQFVIDSSSLTNNTIRTYTMPNASGTLALTSDLGAYLPLTGGTLTGNLTINPSTTDYTLTVSTSTTNNTIKLLGSTASNTSTIGYWSSNGGTGYGALNFTPTNTRFEIVNGGSFSIYTSGNERLTVSSGGTTTLTGALSGTSATFSGTGANSVVSLNVNGANSESTIAKFARGGGEKPFYISSSNNAFVNLATEGAFKFKVNVTADLPYSSGIEALTIASTGAATFSSNQSGATGISITNLSTDTTASAATRFNNSGSTVSYIGLGGASRASYVNIGANILSMYTDNAAGMSFLVDAAGPMSFATNTTERMRITSSGSVLLAKDQVFGINTTDGSDNGYLALCGASGDGDNRGGHIYLSGNERGADAGTVVLSAGNVSGGAVIVRTGATVERMRITSSGLMLLGATSSYTDYGLIQITGDNKGIAIRDSDGFYRAIYNQSGTLYFYNGSNEGYLNSAGAWVNASDISIKKDVKDLEYGLKEVLNLKAKSYKMIDNDLAQIGFIAQEVAEILPELVDESKKGMKGLSYGQMTAVLVKGLQEEDAKVNAQELRIQQLESQIEELKALINK